MNARARTFAPGRVNLIGEHTDYNQGLALPFAIEAGVTATAEALDQPVIEAVALDLGASDSFPVAHPQTARGWRAFVRGAVAELTRAGVPVPGARLEITGNVPRGRRAVLVGRIRGGAGARADRGVRRRPGA